VFTEDGYVTALVTEKHSREDPAELSWEQKGEVMAAADGVTGLEAVSLKTTTPSGMPSAAA
jgi:hypothetical protein